MHVSRRKKDTARSADAEAPQPTQEEHGENGAGAPYDSRFAGVAKKMYERGLSDADVAEALRVSEQTLAQWEADHQDFAEVCESGRQLANGKVHEAVFKRATGYTYTAQRIVGTRIIEYPVYVPPDVNAAKFWLTNRRRDKWAQTPKPDEKASPPKDPFAEFLKSINGNVLRPTED